MSDFSLDFYCCNIVFPIIFQMNVFPYMVLGSNVVEHLKLYVLYSSLKDTSYAKGKKQ